MTTDPIQAAKFDYLLRLGDNCLVLSQQLAAWCGHGPALEEDLALTNVALDLLGQARLWLSYAGEVEGLGRDEDALAFHRDGAAFRNLLLVEQPNDSGGHYADTVARQCLFDLWHQQLLMGLSQSSDQRIADIAGKALKEVRYHVTRSVGLTVALGDGTPVSHSRMQAAVNRLWPYTQEGLESDAVDAACAAQGIAPAADSLAAPWQAAVEAVLGRATLAVPQSPRHQRGGKRGVHSEHLGHLLAPMQYLQRAYPGAQW